MLRRLLTEIRKRLDVVVFTGANLSLQATGMICQFVVLGYVRPELMGIWAAAMLVESYLTVLGMGIVNGMNREYPFFMGRDEPALAAQTIRTTQTFALGNAAVMVVVFAVLGTVYGWDSPRWRIAFWMMACFSAGKVARLYLECSYRVAGKFRTLAKLRFAMIPVHVATLALPIWLGFEGLCIRMAGIQAIAVAGLLVWRPLKAKLGFRKGTFRLLFSTGWRLHLVLYLIMNSRKFPQLALSTLGGSTLLGVSPASVAGLDGKALLGLFTPVGWMFMALFLIVGSFSMYMHPKLTFRYARDRQSVGRTALRVAVKSMLLLSPVAVVGIVALHFLGPIVMPARYAPALPAMQVSLVTSLFDCFGISRIAFIAMKAWKAYFVYIGAMVVLYGVGSFGGFWALPDDRLLGVTLGRMAGSVAMIAVTWFTVTKAVPQETPETTGGGDV